MTLLMIVGIFGIGLAIFVVGMIATIRRHNRAKGAVIAVAEGDSSAHSGVPAATAGSTGTVVMQPVPALRLTFLGLGACAMWYTWGPMMHGPSHDFVLAMLLTSLVFYLVVSIANYEVRYDSAGITAPDWLFREKTYRWEAFEGFRPGGRLTHTLRFHDSGTVHLQKHLVGMSAFLTFMSDVEVMRQRT